MAPRILVVEDDPDFLQFLQFALEQAGYLVFPASSGQSAVRWLTEPGGRPDLAILDVELPDKDVDGLDLCRALKRDAASRKTPVMILTGHNANEDRLAAAKAQADLILHKPIEAATLLKAVGQLLAAPPAARRGLLHRGGFEIDPDRRSVFLNGKAVSDLGPRLFDLLYILAERWPHPVSRRYALSALKLKDRDEQVSVMVSRLRAKLRAELGHELVATVPGEGYRLDPPSVEPSRAG